ncbi:glycerol-3-phosphate dehydrogenase/oxidase [Bacillus tianshenii]|nr:glycerol-3-phosphate dehydrogenase/oxidase [Bacillus tianshenii]
MKRTFSSIERNKVKTELKDNEYDVLVIGGGITGAGIALDAASRGMKTALVEMQDFAAGTSSRSTKLVHGGLRYLKQFEVKMVAEVGKERAIVYENGPHVTTPEWMMLPIYEGGTFGKFSTSVGLRVYDYLAGVKRSERRSMLSREETLRREPNLKKNGLKGSGYYVEYRTDDARLTIEVMKKAVEYGALPLNYAKVEGFEYENGKVVGVHVADQLREEPFTIRAKKVINAAGPWVDLLRDKDNSKKGKTLHHTKGVHLVFDHSVFPLQQAVYFDTPDGRMVFAIPRDGKTYVGTTDTEYKGDLAHPRMTKEDRDYILDAIQFMFPDIHVTEDDVESSWTGLRPLIHEEGKDPSEISRKDEIFFSDSGLITIAGGKLTGYRKMAEHVVNVVAKQFKEEGYKAFNTCQTKNMPISGGEIGGSDKLDAFVETKVAEGMKLGLDLQEAELLARRYGSNIDTIYDYMKSFDTEAYPKLNSSIFAQLKYAIEQEAAATLGDFFIRRSGALFFDINWVKQWEEAVSDYMKDKLGWTEEETERYKEELHTELNDALVSPEEENNSTRKAI